VWWAAYENLIDGLTSELQEEHEEQRYLRSR